MTTITRELINPNFYHVTENVDYKTLCKKINKFKHLFLSKGATKEDNIGTGNTNCRYRYYCMLFCILGTWYISFLTKQSKEHSGELTLHGLTCTYE